MKKFRILCIILTLFAIAARITSILPAHITTLLIYFFVMAVFLSRAAETYSQDKKEWQHWLAAAGLAFIALAAALSATFSTANEEKRIKFMLEAPNMEIAAAYQRVRQEAEASEDGDSSRILSLEHMPSTQNLREAVSALFQGDASRKLIDECISMNEIMAYHISAVNFDYKITVKQVKIVKKEQDGTFYYEAVLRPHGDGVADSEIYVHGLITFDNLATKFIGVKEIREVSIEGGELSAFYESLVEKDGAETAR